MCWGFCWTSDPRRHHTSSFQCKEKNDWLAFVGKFVSWRMEVHIQYMPKLPNNLLSIPSGQQLKDIYRKFVLDHFKEENVRGIHVFYFIYTHYWQSTYLCLLRIALRWMMMKSSPLFLLIIGWREAKQMSPCMYGSLEQQSNWFQCYCTPTGSVKGTST